MGNILNTLAIILVIIWNIGFLGYNARGAFHIVLLIAIIAVIIRAVLDKKKQINSIQYKPIKN